MTCHPHWKACKAHSDVETGSCALGSLLPGMPKQVTAYVLEDSSSPNEKAGARAKAAKWSKAAKASGQPNSYMDLLLKRHYTYCYGIAVYYYYIECFSAKRLKTHDWVHG